MNYLIELIDAWKSWQGSPLPPDFVLWSRPIHWWGRIGIAIQLVAGLAILLEVVGPERIRKRGEKLRSGAERRATKT